MWPLAGPGWTPPPRPTSARLANARWATSRCSLCGDFRRTLLSTCRIAEGDAITVPDTETSTVSPAAGPR
eukprot:6915456-Lingulodinium_polyedra.AAC.1